MDGEDRDSDILDKEKINFTKGSKDQFKYYPDTPTREKLERALLLKDPTKFYDPCAESAKMATRCMERHDQDYKEVCYEFFQAYRECKKDWLEMKKRL
ncbi:Mitochondrial copper homeostasis protein [Komagataella phaffii CBS 7435]|uniref:Cytochrome c oxidase-assembly factor COX23, mitochondrial n=2 Tax=Komagataella phaffii TaxID=460519 RepID=C4R209_KOMPG|nr:Mitochondrial intermembrane space protein that functions in mitochondrial copper homeostasis [Komagataella phaffii GS115]CAH2447922.1 Mitochondrial copper homeostasis protein [Komagataella phaffii CBS 7435]CAY69533.1 Mitochondrial intermembrane space protein that functions in mitochondrial copper homeostasis [Komagataella phaffii GS115]CCA38086.1 Mitochondrial copper homeostasis protein [Komagataella phaffii CBS 7435]